MRGAYAMDKSYTGYAKKVNAGFDISALSEDAHTRRLFEQRAAKTPRYDHEPSPGGRGRDHGGHNSGGDRAVDTGVSETVAAAAEKTAEGRRQVDSSKISTGTRASRKRKTSTWTRTTRTTLTRMRM
jgi:hypothetical protein